jgi:hypothetical protein
MQVNIQDLTISFELEKVSTTGRSHYKAIFFRDGVKLGLLDGYSPSPLIKSAEDMARDAIGFALECPYWEFGEDENQWEIYEMYWYELYLKLGGGHSVYAFEL